MKSFQSPCPSCGAPVAFPVSAALVTVCEFCQSAVARTGKKLEDHGKVADLVQTRSPLEIGLKGKFKRKRFELIGRAQYQHPAGGVWDEWYLSFAGGKLGWLAEAQGKFYLTFEKPLKREDAIPPYEDIRVGHRWDFGGRIGSLAVAEKGTATAGSAEGAIPWAFRPGAEHVFADLHGESGAFATLDFSGEAPRLFLGREVSLDELDIPDIDVGDKGVRATTAVSVNCPRCGGALTLIAPDETQRVTCPSCSSLLDADKGNLQYLKTLHLRKRQPLIPIGTSGTIGGVEYTVIGFLERFVVYAGQMYPWTEYLLYHPREGFRWLVHSDRHWNFVEPISIGDLTRGGLHATYKGERYRLFQRGLATVSHVLGEFSWRVEVGEEVYTRDYVAPPHMLSVEVAGEEGEDAELNASLGTYMQPDEVEAAFGVKDLLHPWSVGPNQPRPPNGVIFRTWGLFLLVLLGLDVLFGPGLFTQKLDQWMFFYAVLFVSIIPLGTLIYNHSFEVKRWSESDYSPYGHDED